MASLEQHWAMELGLALAGLSISGLPARWLTGGQIQLTGGLYWLRSLVPELEPPSVWWVTCRSNLFTASFPQRIPCGR